MGALTLIDGDKVEESNLNRQIAALSKDIGRYKAEVLAERVEEINPRCKVNAVCDMLTESNCAALVDGSSYVADAIDSLAAKAALAVYCTGRGLPIVSAMGAGNRAGWCDFRVADIYKTDYDPLAKKFRKMMKERGVASLKPLPSKRAERSRACRSRLPSAASAWARTSSRGCSANAIDRGLAPSLACDRKRFSKPYFCIIKFTRSNKFGALAGSHLHMLAANENARQVMQILHKLSQSAQSDRREKSASVKTKRIVDLGFVCRSRAPASCN